MNPSWWPSAEKEINKTVEGFTDKLKSNLDDLSPKKIITRKNIFLFRMRNISSTTNFAEKMLDAFQSSSEETIFGNVLEEISISICRNAKDGWKSSSEGIDLEYVFGSERTLIQVKSGKNWGNASQKKSLKLSFEKASKIVRQNNSNLSVRCVEGICYGKSEQKDLGSHIRLVGNCFWIDISDWDGTPNAIMNVLAKHADNGLSSKREETKKRIVDYLLSCGLVQNDKILWNELLSMVLTDFSKK